MWIVVGGKLNSSVKAYAEDLGFGNVKYVGSGVQDFIEFYSSQVLGIVVLDTVANPFNPEEYSEYTGEIYLYSDKEAVPEHSFGYTLTRVGELEGLDIMEMLLEIAEKGGEL